MVVAGGLLLYSWPIFVSDTSFFLAASFVLLIVALMLPGFHGRSFLPLMLVLFIGWCVLSLGWSEDLRGSLFAAVSLIVICSLAAAVSRFGTGTVKEGLLLGFVLIAVSSILVGIFLPGVGRVRVDYAEGALNGIYFHRNTLGSLMALGVAVAAGSAFGEQGKNRMRSFCVAILCAAVAWFSQSGAAMIVVSIIALVAIAWMCFSRLTIASRAAIVPVAFVVSGGFLIPSLAGLMPEVFGRLGRDVTLTGRTDIWEIVLDYVRESPFLGFGWGGVWGDSSHIGSAIRSAFGYTSASSAHNGFIDILLQVGAIGLFLYSLLLGTALARLVRLCSFSNSFIWMMLTMIALLVSSLAESRAVRPDGLFVVSIVAILSLRELNYYRVALGSPWRFQERSRKRIGVAAKC